MTLDDQIRALVRDGLQDEPKPMAAHEVLDRSLEVRPVSVAKSSRRPAVLAGALVAAALVLVAVVTVNHDSTSPVSGPIAHIDRFFVPTSLPDGWTLLHATAVMGPGAVPQPVTIFERTNPPARLEVQTRVNPAITSADAITISPTAHPLTVSDGHGSWSELDVDSRSGFSFSLVRDGSGFTAWGWGVNQEESAIAALAEQITVAPDGVPSIAPSSGFVRGAQSPAVKVTAIATYSLSYGQIGYEDDPMNVTVTRLSGPFDPQLKVGPFAEQQTVDGRLVWVAELVHGWIGGGYAPANLTWMIEPDLQMTVSGTGRDLADFFSELHEVSRADFLHATGIDASRP